MGRDGILSHLPSSDGFYLHICAWSRMLPIFLLLMISAIVATCIFPFGFFAWMCISSLYRRIVFFFKEKKSLQNLISLCFLNEFFVGLINALQILILTSFIDHDSPTLKLTSPRIHRYTPSSDISSHFFLLYSVISKRFFRCNRTLRLWTTTPSWLPSPTTLFLFPQPAPSSITNSLHVAVSVTLL